MAKGPFKYTLLKNILPEKTEIVPFEKGHYFNGKYFTFSPLCLPHMLCKRHLHNAQMPYVCPHRVYSNAEGVSPNFLFAFVLFFPHSTF